MNTLGDPVTRTPRRWLAVLLSLVSPGLGHAYAGFPLRGFAILAVLYLCAAPLLALLAARATLLALVASIGGAVASVIAIAVDAARLAQRPRTRFLARGSVLLVCLGFVAASLPLQIAFEWWRNRALPQSFYAPSAAMMPTLLVGDHFYVDPRNYEPAHGDVVVFRMARGASGTLVPCSENPDLPCEVFIKRIVALPGDTVSFDGAALVLNGELHTSAATPEASFDVGGGEMLAIRRELLGAHDYLIGDLVDRSVPDGKQVIVEPGRYFLVGDNRDNSNDSRYWGTVPRADIVGKATRIYWSWENTESWLRMANPAVVWKLLREKTRWKRIGLVIE